MRRRDGQQLVVLENARRCAMPPARCIGYEGTLADITERKRAEQAMLRREGARAGHAASRSAMRSSPPTPPGASTTSTRSPSSLTGWTLDEARGQPIDAVLNVVNEVDARADREPRRAVPARGARRHPRPTTPCSSTRAGHEVAIQNSAAPIRDRQGG